MSDAITQAYSNASRYLPWNLISELESGECRPLWLGHTDRFLVARGGAGKRTFVRVDCQRGTVAPAFDHLAAARFLSAALGKQVSADDIPGELVSASSDGAAVVIGIFDRRFVCKLEGESWSEDTSKSAQANQLLSPDGLSALEFRGHDLWIVQTKNGDARRLTFDGAEGLAYAKSPDANLITIAAKLDGRPRLPVALWSPDSKTVLTHRLDERAVRCVSLVQSRPKDGGARPVAHSYRLPFAGDESLPTVDLILIDIDTGAITEVEGPAFLAPSTSPIELGYIWWSSDSSRVFALREARAAKSLALEVISARDGSLRSVIREDAQTFLQASTRFLMRTTTVVEGADEVLWFSQRDGWGHLYVHDLQSGEFKRRLTAGAWNVLDIHRIDENERRVYFTACGREAGRDPYFAHLYRVSFDGGEPELLTPEDADHLIIQPTSPLRVSISKYGPARSDPAFSPTGKYFVDNVSTADSFAYSVVRRADGGMVSELWKTDADKLLKRGWRWPERIVVTAADGTTKLFGLLYLPDDLDPSRKYPIIDLTYPGPHAIRTPKRSFGEDISNLGWYSQGKALSELGFAVVCLDARGTPFRSKSFQDHAYENVQDTGIPDRIAGIRQLADTRPYMDLERVGIIGHSAGGYGAARAILAHGHFYKAAVSSAGPHEPSAYLSLFFEQFLGLYDEAKYKAASNLPLASGLKGALFLGVGDMDENTHPAHTLALADALIAANKDFELLLMPNGDHTVVANGYYIRRQWDFLVRNLLGVEPPKGFLVRSPTYAGPEN